jgi:hypothetical protein
MLFAGGCASTSPIINPICLTTYDPNDQNALDTCKGQYESLANFKAWAVGSYRVKGEVEGVRTWCYGKSSQEEANTCALKYCNYMVFEQPRAWFPFKDEGSGVSCLINKEGEKDVYEENRDEEIRIAKELAKLDSLYKKRKEDEQKRMEEEKRQAFMTELINRCLSFGFEGRKEIASCLQQEVFNEKRLASISRPTYYFEKQEEKGWWEKLIEEALDPERIREAQQDAKIRCLEAGKRC